MLIAAAFYRCLLPLLFVAAFCCHLLLPIIRHGQIYAGKLKIIYKAFLSLSRVVLP